MRSLFGLLLFLVSGVAGLLMLAFGLMADGRHDVFDGFGLTIAWWGPLFWLGILMMRGAESRVGRAEHVFFIVAVLACVAGLIPVLQRTPHIGWSAILIGLLIGGVTLFALAQGFLSVGKPKLPERPPHVIPGLTVG